MNNNNAPIGIFDSGLGGLTVAAALQQLLPHENFIYLGDTARVPYGNKSKETVLQFGCENASFLADHNVKLIIAACNTVSSLAIDGIRSNLKKHNIDIPVIGVLEAGVEAVLKTGLNDIAVIGTHATVASGAYTRHLHKKSTKLKIRSKACPLFVPIVEEGLANHEIALSTINFYLEELRTNPPDALLLGCTHYPILMNSLRKYLDRRTLIIDSASAVAQFAETFLEKNSLINHSRTPGTGEFFVTDAPELFERQAERFLGHKIKCVKHA